MGQKQRITKIAEKLGLKYLGVRDYRCFMFYRESDGLYLAQEMYEAVILADANDTDMLHELRSLVRAELEDYDARPEWAKVTESRPGGITLGAEYDGTRVVAVDYYDESFRLDDGRTIQAAELSA